MEMLLIGLGGGSAFIVVLILRQDRIDNTDPKVFTNEQIGLVAAALD